jgi:ribosome-binding ATPase YchF (GTP1/OBG family)
MSAWTAVHRMAKPPERLVHLVLKSHDGRVAKSEEKHEPVSDIDTVSMEKPNSA